MKVLALHISWSPPSLPPSLLTRRIQSWMALVMWGMTCTVLPGEGGRKGGSGRVGGWKEWREGGREEGCTEQKVERGREMEGEREENVEGGRERGREGGRNVPRYSPFRSRSMTDW